MTSTRAASENQATVTYGKRPPVYALRVIRAMIAQRAAKTIGPDGFAIVAAIAAEEDARHYRGPATMFNGALVDVCGFSDERALVKARSKAIAGGWLSYQPGAKRRPGVYATLIPGEATDVNSEKFTNKSVGESVEDPPSLSPAHSPADLQVNPEYTRTFPCKNAGPLNLYPNTEEPPPSPSTEEEGERDARLAVAKAGCNDGSIVATAIDHGMTPTMILAIVSHFVANPGKWEPGALAWRLTQQGMSVHAADQGWPPPNAAWLERKRDVAHRQAGHRPPESRRAQLERLHGQRLDGLSEIDLQTLVAQLPSTMQQRAAGVVRAGNGLRSSTMREDLLELIDRNRKPELATA